MPDTFTYHGAPPEMDAEYKALLYAVGVALSNWMAIEVQAQQTFAIAMLVWDSAASRAVFRAAINANARLAMVNEAVVHSLTHPEPSDLLERWIKIYAKAKKLAKRRNAVAHGQACIVAGPSNENGDSYALGPRIVDPLATYSGGAQMMIEGISLKQLEEMQVSFHALAHEMYEHGGELYAYLRQLRESREP